MAIQASLGTPYDWGGDDPIEGYDCSGWVQEMMWSVGLLRGDRQDRTAAGQFTYWNNRDCFHDKIPEFTKNILGEMRAPPDLFGWPVFFKAKKVSKIIHVELCLDREISVGARGDSTVKTRKQAAEKNAYIKCRKIFDRNNMRFAGVANPW